jgi:hypothetical protein
MDSNFRFRVRCKRDLVKAIIVGFVCKPPSPDYLRLLSRASLKAGSSEVSEP